MKVRQRYNAPTFDGKLVLKKSKLCQITLPLHFLKNELEVKAQTNLTGTDETASMRQS